MKIIVIASVDATNLSIQNVIQQFIMRGHKVDVFGKFMDNKSIRMFLQLGINVQPVRKLTSNIIKTYDIAFCGTDAMDILRLENIYVFNYNFIFIDSWPTEGSDFMFTICTERQMRKKEDCASMPIGNPKNDTPAKEVVDNKQLLYIDAGHRPFGSKGKRQVAQMLLDVCIKFPEYRLVVKPRWLLSDRKNRTHWNRNHIYSVLHEIAGDSLPANLVLLDRHLDLQDLIDESTSVITTSYSTYLDAALRGKGVLIVGGLDSDDKYEIRTNVIEQEHIRLAERTGCLVDVNRIIENLPYGRMCDSEHLQQMIPFQDGVSERIVDVIEWIVERFISKGLFPENKSYRYETYREEMCADPAIDFQYLKRKRFKNSILSTTRTFDWADADIDYTQYFEVLESECQRVSLDGEGYSELYAKMERVRKEIIIANQEKLTDDPLNQALLFQAYFDLELYECISGILPNKVLATGPYHYYMGKIEAKRGSGQSSLSHIKKYFQEVNLRPYEKYYQDTIGFYRNAINLFCDQYDGTNLSQESAFEIYNAIVTNDRADLITNAVRGKLNKFSNYIPAIGAHMINVGMSEQAMICMFWCMDNMERRLQTLQRNIPKKSKSYVVTVIQKGIQCLREKGVLYTLKRLMLKIKKRITN